MSIVEFQGGRITRRYLMNKTKDDLAGMYLQLLDSRTSLEAQLAAVTAERDALLEALTPSAETKAAYMGEFKVSFPSVDEDGEEALTVADVPWTAIKEIMRAIRSRAEAIAKVRGGEG